jgi:hypothetical protein
MTPILTQVLVKKKITASRSLFAAKEPSVADEERLYYKDIAGFIIFLLVVFCVLMISMYA